MNDHAIQAALGGLLHDIGKFALRAGETPGQTWDAEAKDDYRYKHALLSVDIAGQMLGQAWPEARQAIAFHHRPEHAAAGRVARLVAIADRLSAGERIPSDEAEPQRLLSIFARLYADEEALAIEPRYLPLKPLRMDEETLFAQPTPPRDDAQRDYEALWAEFALAIQRQPPDMDGMTLVQQVLQLLLRHTWCIPSAAWRSVPDVSLYDHSRMTAALAVCLTSQTDAALDALLASPARGDQPLALLVGGDISGIQDFLYTITPRGATPALRGRSFYLQMLTEAVAQYLLRVLGLPLTNLVYAGGGHFYLLTPPDVQSDLAQAQRYVSRVLLRHHGGDLYLAMAHQPLVRDDFYDGRLSAAWERIGAHLHRAKERRFAELGDALHGLLFVPWRDQGNREHECQVCHREHVATRLDEEWRKCPMCRSFEALGDDLRWARYLSMDEIATSWDSDEDASGSVEDVLAAFGLRISLSAGLPVEARDDVQRSVWYALADEALDALQPAPRRAVGRKLLVNVTPLAGEHVASNDRLAQASRGIDRLGVLRMDVDDLGRMFREGLGQGASLSRIAALSQAISLYFEGYVEILAQQCNPANQTHRAYSIYSGGDDLFFVGAWDAMLKLAQEIRSDFEAYTGQHPQLHLSGGLVLVERHYPLYRAAEEAREAESEAKRMAGKNAFTFLGQTLPWSTFADMARLSAKLDEMIESGRAPRSLLRLLMRAQEAHDEIAERRAREGADRTVDGAPQGYYGPWIPRLEYALTRMAERHRGAADEIGVLRSTLRQERYGSIRWIGLAARWAELLNRTKKENMS